MTLSNEKRQQVERVIARAFIDSAIRAGFSVSVNDGEETTVCQSSNRVDIFRAMMTTDADTLILYRAGKYTGSVVFIYGNDGFDVIADYSICLESFGVFDRAEAIAARFDA